jgi:hypothetical protein
MGGQARQGACDQGDCDQGTEKRSRADGKRISSWWLTLSSSLAGILELDK